MGHQDDGLGTLVDGILDRWDGADNSLVVGDFSVGVEGDVEINLS